MRKILTIISILLGFNSYSQITLDFQSPARYLTPVRLSSTETKYLDNDQWRLNHNMSFDLYNMDGTLYKTIQMPPKPTATAFSYFVDAVSRTLFDNDSSTIEYLIYYEFDSVPGHQMTETKVIREDGTILLDEPYGIAYSNTIFSTEQGTKLMVIEYLHANGTLLPYWTKIFSLPGNIASGPEDPKIEKESFSFYPNPNDGKFFIKINSKENKPQTIDLYSTTGKLINSFESTKQLNLINAPGLSDGLYFLKSGSNSSVKRMIIQK